MTNPTSNFGWQMPTPTDLVTDLPADFEVFGQAVDTDFADLLGGTTGQILSKATNADMDFAWITNDVGDITAVNVTSPITGGGSSGAVTIGINAATTSVVGAVQLSDSTSTTSSVLASTPTATKAAYDLADAAIAKSTVTTAGDIIYRDATVPVRLGIGTAGQVLKVNAGATAPEWGTVSGGGKVLQVVTANITTDTTISSTSYTDTSMTVSITPTSATSKILVLFALQCRLSTTANDTVGFGLKLLRDATTIVDMSAGGSSRAFAIQATADGIPTLASTIYTNYNYLDSPATTSATTYKVQAALNSTAASRSARFQMQNIPSVITLLEIGA
jgi:hypothetical protein